MASAAFTRDAQAAAVRVTTEAGLRSAIASATAGTTITVADGTYRLVDQLDTRAGGTSAANIKVVAEHSKAAIIETNGSEEAFHISHPYWWFDGLYIRVNGGSMHAYKLDTDGHHARISNSKMELQPGAEAGVKGAGGGDAPYPDYAIVEKSEIYMTSPTTYYLAEGLDAVGVKGWIIRDNIVHGIKTSAGGVAYGLMTKGNSQSTVMERNTVYDCFIGLSLGGGGTGSQWVRAYDATYEDRNGIIRNNVVMHSRDVAIYIYQANNAHIYNNTLFDSFQSCGTGCSSIDVRISGATADVRNNIMDKPVNDREGGTHTAAYNLTLPTPTYAAWFVNANGRDFRLLSGAPAINAGQALSQVTNDINKRARPQGGVTDIGATEY